MSPAPESPYERLLALGLSGLELARDGRLHELAACQRAQQDLISALPDQPPAEARAALERCGLVERQIESELRGARTGALEALTQLRQVRRALAGYAPTRQRPQLISADA